MSDEIVSWIGFLAFGAWFLWLVFKRQNFVTQSKMQAAEYRNKLLEKFTNTKELTEFLQTESWKKLLETSPVIKPHPLTSVKRFIAGGIISLFIGIGFLINAHNYSGFTDIHELRKAAEFNSWGILFVALGFGFLITALVLYLFARKLKLTENKN